ncbi:MAG: hypothetical protein QM714_07010 [Nocardioides sp.]|uniref:hypothetical protein n=1 Tax=Nocardioides sp. TaxID=35761 RepID=UPI0039E5DCCA
MATDATPAEFMAVELSRYLRDDEWGACGAYSEIPMAAFLLARAQHAPNLWWMSGGGGAINSSCTLVESSSSYNTHYRAEAIFDIEDIVDYEFGGWRRKPNVGLFGGIQVDRRGAANMVGIGPYDNLALRGPGTVGLAFAAHFSRIMIYLHDHNSRVLCEKVDYVCATGHGELRDTYARPHSKGGERIVTPQAVFTFNPDGYAQLQHVMPGYSVDDVRQHTGFEFDVAEGFSETPAPTSEQLDLIRGQIDPEGRLNQITLGSW